MPANVFSIVSSYFVGPSWWHFRMFGVSVSECSELDLSQSFYLSIHIGKPNILHARMCTVSLIYLVASLQAIQSSASFLFSPLTYPKSVYVYLLKLYLQHSYINVLLITLLSFSILSTCPNCLGLLLHIIYFTYTVLSIPNLVQDYSTMLPHSRWSLTTAILFQGAVWIRGPDKCSQVGGNWRWVHAYTSEYSTPTSRGVTEYRTPTCVEFSGTADTTHTVLLSA